MAFTQQEYDTLKAAAASGLQTVHYSDRTVAYQSLKEMRELLAQMERQLSGGSSYIVVTTSKGL